MPTPDTFVVAPVTTFPVTKVDKVPMLKSGAGGGTGPAPTTGQIWPL